MAKFQALTLLSLHVSGRLWFPIASIKISSLYWNLTKFSCGTYEAGWIFSVVPERSCPFHHRFYHQLGNVHSKCHTSNFLVLYKTSYHRLCPPITSNIIPLHTEIPSFSHDSHFSLHRKMNNHMLVQPHACPVWIPVYPLNLIYTLPVFLLLFSKNLTYRFLTFKIQISNPFPFLRLHFVHVQNPCNSVVIQTVLT